MHMLLTPCPDLCKSFFFTAVSHFPPTISTLSSHTPFFQPLVLLFAKTFFQIASEIQSLNVLLQTQSSELKMSQKIGDGKKEEEMARKEKECGPKWKGNVESGKW
jgi:hypothetical protein